MYMYVHEAFAVAQPKEMVVHLRPLTMYLALDDDSSAEEQWVAMKDADFAMQRVALRHLGVYIYI